MKKILKIVSWSTLTPRDAPGMVMNHENYLKVITMHDELIHEQKETISSLTHKLNNTRAQLQSALSKIKE